MKDILVIRLSAFGDVLLTTPVLARLKKIFPEAHVRFLVKEKHAAFIAASPDVDEILTWKQGESLWDIRRKISEREIDLLLDLQSNLRTRILTTFLKAGIKRRYRKPYLNRLLLVYLKLNRYGETTKISDRYFETLTGIDNNPLTEKVTLSRAALPREVTHFSTSGGILIAPGARWGTKKWPAEYFASLASKILEKHARQKITWLGGSGEAELFEFLAKHPYLARHAKRMLFLPGRLSVPQMATLADKADAVVCNDSGLMHLLSASDKPLIALFLSTVEEFGFYPRGKNASVLTARDIPCRPCDHKGLASCPKKHFRCARDLTADQVYAAVAAHLSPTRRG
jgi:ADP-heptose:LPS heptosyltransferase